MKTAGAAVQIADRSPEGAPEGAGTPSGCTGRRAEWIALARLHGGIFTRVQWTSFPGCHHEKAVLVVRARAGVLYRLICVPPVPLGHGPHTTRENDVGSRRAPRRSRRAHRRDAEALAHKGLARRFPGRPVAAENAKAGLGATRPRRSATLLLPWDGGTERTCGRCCQVGSRTA